MEQTEAQASVSSATASISNVINDCLDLFHKVKLFYKDLPNGRDNTPALQELHKNVTAEYKDLAGTYPAIVAAIVWSCKFYPDAAYKYFSYVSANKWKTKEEYLEIQSLYNVFVFRHEHPRASPKEIAEYRRRSFNEVKKETKIFEETAAKVTQQLNEERQESIDFRKERIIKMLEVIKNNNS